MATSLMVKKALEAAGDLEKEGISVEVIDPRTIRPLDIDIIVNSVKKTGRLVVVHEACKTYGIAGEIISLVNEHAFSSLKSAPARVCGMDIPIPVNKTLEAMAVPSKQNIIEGIKKVLI